MDTENTISMSFSVPTVYVQERTTAGITTIRTATEDMVLRMRHHSLVTEAMEADTNTPVRAAVVTAVVTAAVTAAVTPTLAAVPVFSALFQDP